ncbi:MAG: hypothetical protein FD121_1652, partial [Gallionellaceae bacterium]
MQLEVRHTLAVWVELRAWKATAAIRARFYTIGAVAAGWSTPTVRTITRTTRLGVAGDADRIARAVLQGVTLSVTMGIRSVVKETAAHAIIVFIVCLRTHFALSALPVVAAGAVAPRANCAIDELRVAGTIRDHRATTVALAHWVVGEVRGTAAGVGARSAPGAPRRKAVAPDVVISILGPPTRARDDGTRHITHGKVGVGWVSTRGTVQCRIIQSFHLLRQWHWQPVAKSPVTLTVFLLQSIEMLHARLQVGYPVKPTLHAAQLAAASYPVGHAEQFSDD